MISTIGARSRPNKSVAAFTLIELFLVILLISVIIGMSTPLFRNAFSNLALKNTSFTISRLANYGQEMAIIDRADYRLNINYKSGTFWLAKSRPQDGSSKYEQLTGMYGKVFRFPDGAEVSGPEKIDFYPDGRCEKAQIRVTDAHGTGYVVRTLGFGRRITVEDAGQ